MEGNRTNEIFELAADLVNYTDKHVFLTGKAGTGKTTFLKYIRDNTHKNTAIVAPTGVAAINAGGTTLHSLLQLPFGVFVPEGSRPMHLETREEIHDRQSLVRRLRITGNKRKVIEALELLIIDEISMVRADLLDMVDSVLRFVRKRPNIPFGGVQMLYIGDMFQLPPVLKDNDREILKDYYKSQFFFDARVIQQAPPQYVELTHVYRQSDETFIRVLNQVRNNQLTDDGLTLLQSRFIPDFKAPKGENYITLATHNYMADQINAEELATLSTRVFEFEATVEEDFPEHAYPVEKLLRLKLGAQVMFLKNDTETPRKFFNGKIGIITDIDKDKIKVKCPNDPEPIMVPKEVWRNIRYSYEQNTRTVKEDELGTFTQFPLRLAWAITIHKSQGLTFEKAIINAGKAFESGQVYVALSRCTSLQGMVLLSPIHKGLVMTHERIAMFGRKERLLTDLQKQTAVAKQVYIRKQLMVVFNFSEAHLKVVQLHQLFTGIKDIFNAKTGEWLQTLHMQVEQLVRQTQPLPAQLSPLLEQGEDFEQNVMIQAFLKTNSTSILSFIDENLWPHWRKMPGMEPGHSRKLAEDYFVIVDSINELLKERILRLNRLKAGFTVHGFFGQRKLKEVMEAQKQVISNKSSSDKSTPNPTYRSYAAKLEDEQGDRPIEHIELYRILRKLTDAIVNREQVPSYMIANAETLKEICTWLPQTLEDLAKIKGFGPKKIEWVGEEFLDEILDYCDTHGLGTRINEKEAHAGKRERGIRKLNGGAGEKTTLEKTIELFREKKTVSEIATERNLSPGTIEGHLNDALLLGVVTIDELLTGEKRQIIESVIPEDLTAVQLRPLIEQLGEGFRYGELRWVLTNKKIQSNKKGADGG
jgi:DNA-binding CsgD family transcriptional regulator